MVVQLPKYTEEINLRLNLEYLEDFVLDENRIPLRSNIDLLIERGLKDSLQEIRNELRKSPDRAV